MQDAIIRYFDGTEVATKVSQYDLAQWERSQSYTPDRTALTGRYMGFSALRRTKALPDNTKGRPVSYAEWDLLCDEVELLNEDEPDPTHPDHSPES